MVPRAVSRRAGRGARLADVVDAATRRRCRRPARASRRASSTCSTPSASARWRSASAAIRPSPSGCVHTIRAVGTVIGASARLTAGRLRRACADRSAPAGRSRRRRRQRRGDRGRRSRPRAVAARRSTSCCATARALRRASILLYGARSPSDILFRASSSAGARRLDIDIDGHRRSRRRADWRGMSAWSRR